MKTSFIILMTFVLLGITFHAAAGMLSGKVNIAKSHGQWKSVVYIEGLNGKYPLPDKRPRMDHINQQFAPIVLPVLRGSTVDFANSDEVFHSAFSFSTSNTFDLGIYGPGLEKFVTFSNSGPVEIFCHIHDHMFGYILVLENPFFTTTGQDGRFSIENIPPGTYNVSAWLSPREHVTRTITVRRNETVSVVMDIK